MVLDAGDAGVRRRRPSCVSCSVSSFSVLIFSSFHFVMLCSSAFSLYPPFVIISGGIKTHSCRLRAIFCLVLICGPPVAFSAALDENLKSKICLFSRTRFTHLTHTVQRGRVWFGVFYSVLGDLTSEALKRETTRSGSSTLGARRQFSLLGAKRLFETPHAFFSLMVPLEVSTTVSESTANSRTFGASPSRPISLSANMWMNCLHGPRIYNPHIQSSWIPAKSVLMLLRVEPDIARTISSRWLQHGRFRSISTLSSSPNLVELSLSYAGVKKYCWPGSSLLCSAMKNMDVVLKLKDPASEIDPQGNAKDVFQPQWSSTDTWTIQLSDLENAEPSYVRLLSPIGTFIPSGTFIPTGNFNPSGPFILTGTFLPTGIFILSRILISLKNSILAALISIILVCTESAETTVNMHMRTEVIEPVLKSLLKLTISLSPVEVLLKQVSFTSLVLSYFNNAHGDLPNFVKFVSLSVVCNFCFLVLADRLSIRVWIVMYLSFVIA